MSTRERGRLDVFRAWPPGYAAMQALEQALTDAALDAGLLELVRTRASQLNGCAFCLNMHAKAAMVHGETPLRLIQLSAWRDADGFTPTERAALALTEALTRCADGVTDNVLDDARTHFSAIELVQLVYAITAINLWNRLAIADRTSTPLGRT